MVDVTVVRYSFEGEKFEILVKPDPALDYKLGKKKDVSAVLVSDEIYTDSMITTGLVGLTYVLAYRLLGRNLWVVIIAHGLTDTLSFIFLYSGRM